MKVKALERLRLKGAWIAPGEVFEHDNEQEVWNLINDKRLSIAGEESKAALTQEDHQEPEPVIEQPSETKSKSRKSK